METPDVRHMYEMLARIERRSHAEAHPGYRFSPQKRRQSPSPKTSMKAQATSPPKIKDAKPVFLKDAVLDTEGS
jgi:hypothetical protein